MAGEQIPANDEPAAGLPSDSGTHQHYVQLMHMTRAWCQSVLELLVSS
jgi:hypothetical protein